MAIGIADFETLYQTYYPLDQLKYMLPTGSVLLNMMLGGDTDTKVSGDIVDMPWLIGPSVGASQTYSVAAAAAAKAPVSLRPTVRMSQFYKNFSWLDKDEILSEGEASYGRLMEVVVFGARLNFLGNLDAILHGYGNGNRAAFTYVSSTPTVITLIASPTQLTGDTGNPTLGAAIGQALFEVNNTVVVTSTNPADGTPPTIVAGGPYTVTKVNDQVLTVTPALSGLTNGNVYGLAMEGDTLGFATGNLNPAIIGVNAFNPYGGPSATDNFLGVNRSIYGTRAAGTWFNGSGGGYSVEQVLRKASTQMRNTGLEPGGVIACMEPDDYDTLDFKLAAQNRYTAHKVGEVFMEAIAVNSSMGRMATMVDIRQQKGQVRLYAPDAVTLMYRDGLPHFARLATGETQYFGSNYDGREMRMRGYLQTFVADPRKLSVASLPPTT